MDYRERIRNFKDRMRHSKGYAIGYGIGHCFAILAGIAFYTVECGYKAITRLPASR